MNESEWGFGAASFLLVVVDTGFVFHMQAVLRCFFEASLKSFAE
jgi:hypothetical protein